MNIGYFKLSPPKTKEQLPSPQKFKMLSSGQIPIVARLSLPITALLLPIVFIIGLQFGQFSAQKIARNDSYQVITNVDLPASVSFVPSLVEPIMSQVEKVYNLVIDFIYRIKDNWFNFLFLNPTKSPTTSEVDVELLREQIKADILDQLSSQSEGAPPQTKGSSYEIAVAPNLQSDTLDNLRADLPKMFADKVKVNFSADGLSGKVTPIFRDVGEGKEYIFVLNPK